MTYVLTYATDIIDREDTGGHMVACLAELVRAVRHKYLCHTRSYASERDVVAVHVSPRRRVSRGGYLSGGAYRGVGMPLFELELALVGPDGEGYVHFHEVRATDRASLRAELKAIFRNAKVGR